MSQVKRKPGQYWDKSANPIIVKGGGYHCTKISPGCIHCWAETTNLRFHNRIPYDGTRVEFELDQAILDKVIRRKTRTIYFMCDLMDYLHGRVPDALIWDLFKFMAENPQHIYLILTKRADRFCNLIPTIRSKLVNRLFHVKLGLTVCNQVEANEKIPMVLPFIDWLSLEPMLGAIDLEGGGRCWLSDAGLRIPWIVIGGETGPGARPMHPEWVRSVRDQCLDAGVPFFFKNCGAWKPILLGEVSENRGLDIFKGLHFISPDGTLKKDPGPDKHDELLKRNCWPIQRRRGKDYYLDGRIYNEVPTWN